MTGTLQQIFDTDDPVALVTGSGSARVGREIAAELSRRGCHVALHANQSVAEADAAALQWHKHFDRRAFVVTGTLEDDQTCQRIVDETVSHYGRVDILVNAAAIWSPRKLRDVTGDEVRRYFQINCVAPLLCARAAGQVMRHQATGGAIVNVGDWATVRPYSEHAAYFPSKGAVEAMTRSMAVELSHWNPQLRVNCVLPGPVLPTDDTTQDVLERLAESTLVKRLGRPDDVAHAVAMMCENTFINGVCLPIDGGRSVFAPDGLQRGLNTG